MDWIYLLWDLILTTYALMWSLIAGYLFVVLLWGKAEEGVWVVVVFALLNIVAASTICICTTRCRERWRRDVTEDYDEL